MSMPKTSTPCFDDPAKRLPSSLADNQLDHLERMIVSFARSNKPNVLGWLDHEYWEKRIRTLTEENDLVATQRHRVIRLLDMLERNVVLSAHNRTAA